MMKAECDEALLQLVESYQLGTGDHSIAQDVLRWFQQSTPNRAQSAVRRTNDHGETALHVLLRRRGARGGTSGSYAGEDVDLLRAVRAFIAAAPDVARARDARGLLPLHHACRDRACDCGVIRVLVEAHPAGLGALSSRGNALRRCHTPFGWDYATAVGGHFGEFVAYVVASDADPAPDPAGTPQAESTRGARRERVREARRARHRLLDYCKDWVPPDILKKGMLHDGNLESRAMVRWLNEMPCKRSVVFFMVFEFYLHLLWIGTFMLATTRHVAENTAPAFRLQGWEPAALLAFAALFFAGEFYQLYRFAVTNAIGQYWMDAWNWIDLIAIGLVSASALEFLQEDRATNYNLLIAAGFFQLVLFISYLKKTFFPFSKFVTGVIKIFWALAPFAAISAITLVAFAYMYYVKAKDSDLYAHQHTNDTNNIKNTSQSIQPPEDPYATLTGSLVTVFSPFVPGPLEENTKFLDYLFGILIIIVLLNVVIAVVSEAWEHATDEANEAFWNYRLDLILEKTRGQRDFPWTVSCKCFRGLDDFYINDETVGTRTEELAGKLALTRRERGWLFCLFTVTKSMVFIILGFPTFGILWPKFFRQILFTPPKPKENPTERQIEHIVDEINVCKTDIAGCRKEVAALSAKVDTQIELMQQILSKFK